MNNNTTLAQHIITTIEEQVAAHNQMIIDQLEARDMEWDSIEDTTERVSFYLERAYRFDDAPAEATFLLEEELTHALAAAYSEVIEDEDGAGHTAEDIAAAANELREIEPFTILANEGLEAAEAAVTEHFAAAATQAREDFLDTLN